MKKCQYCSTALNDDVYQCPACGGQQEIPRQQAKTPAAAPAISPLYEFKSFGIFSLTVFPNRITIIDKRGGVASMMSPKTTDILIKNITGINTRGFLQKLEITMNDGTLREIPVIGGKDSAKVREIVLGLLL